MSNRKLNKRLRRAVQTGDTATTAVILTVLSQRVHVGTYPGEGRSRKFVDRRKEADRMACRRGRRDD